MLIVFFSEQAVPYGYMMLHIYKVLGMYLKSIYSVQSPPSLESDTLEHDREDQLLAINGVQRFLKQYISIPYLYTYICILFSRMFFIVLLWN